MNTFITIMGWLCIASICVAIAGGMVAAAASAIELALARFERAIESRVRQELGRDIQSCSHWFSESAETWVAIKVLGERMTKGYATDVDRWRDEWRERLRAAPGKSEVRE